MVANFEENVDYLISLNVEENSKGRPTEEIYLTKDCFKQLAMLASTEKGKAIRLYFIQCEKELKQIKAAAPQLPTDYLSALKALVQSEEEKQQLALKAAEAEARIVQMAPKIEIYQRLTDDTGTLSFADAAKLIKVMGRNNLMQFLREQKVLQISNTPYQKHVDAGYFIVIESETNVGFKLTTRVTQRGVEFITKLLEREGYIQKAV